MSIEDGFINNYCEKQNLTAKFFSSKLVHKLFKRLFLSVMIYMFVCSIQAKVQNYCSNRGTPVYDIRVGK